MGGKKPDGYIESTKMMLCYIQKTEGRGVVHERQRWERLVQAAILYYFFVAYIIIEEVEIQ